MNYNEDYDLALDARAEARDLRIDGMRDDFDDAWADDPCGIDNPECDWGEEEIDPDTVAWVCYTH